MLYRLVYVRSEFSVMTGKLLNILCVSLLFNIVQNQSSMCFVQCVIIIIIIISNELD